MLALSQVLPPSATITADGHLEVGGCDLVLLAEEFGTPLVVYDEGLLRETCRAYRDAMAAHAPDTEVVYASKAYYGLAMLRLVHEEGLAVDVASGGELHAALTAGVPPERIYMHGNNKDGREVADALHAGVGTLIVDSFDEIALVERFAGARDARVRVLVRVTPGVKPSTHSYISTGQLDSKFGFSLEPGLARRAMEAVREAPRLELAGSTPPGLPAVRPGRVPRRGGPSWPAWWPRPATTTWARSTWAGAWAWRTRARTVPPAIEAWAEAVAEAVRDEWARVGRPMPRLLVEPGAGDRRPRGPHPLPGGRGQGDAGRADLRRGGRGHERPAAAMLYGAVYEPFLANRADEEPARTLRLVGKHCESGDVLVAERRPARDAGRRPGLPAGHRGLRGVDGLELQRGDAAGGGVRATAATPAWSRGVRPTPTSWPATSCRDRRGAVRSACSGAGPSARPWCGCCASSARPSSAPRGTASRWARSWCATSPGRGRGWTPRC